MRFAIKFCYFGFVLHLSSKVLNPAKTVPVSNGGGAVVVSWMGLSGKSCLIKLIKSRKCRCYNISCKTREWGLECKEVPSHKEERVWKQEFGVLEVFGSPPATTLAMGHGKI